MNEFELFSGETRREGICTWLTNQPEILAACPERFRGYTEWTEAAGACFFGGPRWLFERSRLKSSDKDVLERQIKCLDTIMLTLGYEHEDKLAVISWMLSVALAEPPRLSAGQRGDVLGELPPMPFSG